MKFLTIVRHAKSSWQASGLADHDRILNARGERDAPIMAARLVEHGVRPSLILSSTAVRAFTTAKILAAKMGYPKEFLQREKDLYHASADRILSIVAGQDNGFNSILVVGHNPGMTSLANQLVPGITNNLPTAGVLSIVADCEDWNLIRSSSIELAVYDYPKCAAKD